MPPPRKIGIPKVDVEFVLLQEERLDDVIELLVKHFLTREITFSLVSQLAGGRPNEHRGWLRDSIREWDWHNSWLALDAASGAVVGASLSATYHADEPDPYWRWWDSACQASVRYRSFLAYIDPIFNIFRDLNVDSVTENVILVVDPRYGGRGLGAELCRLVSEQGACQTGAAVAMCYATSPLTQRIYERLGFSVGAEVRYAATPLAKLPQPADGQPATTCRIMFKRMPGMAKPRT